MAVAGLCMAFQAMAQDPSPGTVEYQVSAVGNASSGSFAPYFIGSNNYGITPQKGDALVSAGVFHRLDTTARWGFGYGVELIAGYGTSNRYSRYDASAGTWRLSTAGPASVKVQQLYADVRYRSLFLSVGMKQLGNVVSDDRLASGDFVHSNNARPVPQVRMGFIDFQDIPFTNGWMQVEGCFSFGKFMDDSNLEDRYNHYSYHITLGSLYHYKRIMFRTKPSKPFSVTFGMELAGQFGGTATYYRDGAVERTEHWSRSLRAFMDMLIPTGTGAESFYRGNSLGSWDFKARYRLRSGAELTGYFMWPWEDGSGMAKRNGWDGIWGIQWKSHRPALISGAVVEYIDFRNQSGPIHWSPNDAPGTTITTDCSGSDTYYNNSAYNAYANYGLSLGTPFMLSPLYNLDGFPAYLHNCTNGIHVALEGSLTPSLGYLVKYSYQHAWGSGRNILSAKSLRDNSAMLQMTYDASATITPGLSVKAMLAIDRGSLRGNNFGALLSVTYSGMFNL